MDVKPVGLTLDGRVYTGAIGGDAHIKAFARFAEAKVPPQMRAFTDALRRESRILALAETASDEEIHAAFGDDLSRTAKYQVAFRDLIGASIVARAELGDQSLQNVILTLIEEVRPLEHPLEFNLGPDRLAKNQTSAELLAELKVEVSEDIDRLAQNITLWLDALVESKHIGLVERLGPNAVKYHFFRMWSAKKEIGRDVYDPGMSQQGRNVTTAVTSEVSVTCERRVHTIVDARTYELGQFRDYVPQRIGALIDGMPPEVRQFARIIGGNTTQEESFRQFGETHTEVEKKTVFVPDPAVVLFDRWAIGGWGGSENEPVASTYAGHPLRRANTWLVASLGLAFILMLGGYYVAGVRGAIMIGAVSIAFVLFSQLGMRMRGSGTR